MELFDLFENERNEGFVYWGEKFCDQWGTQEFISKSIDDACDFFHISEPAEIYLDSDYTFVKTENPDQFNDDVLFFSKEELQRLGINNKYSVDLYMTHEMGHRMLQGLYCQMDSWDEELFCDFLAGVRAGLNHIDTTEFNNALGKMEESLTHPGGEQRVQAVEQGVKFAKEYLSLHNDTPPSFRDCLEHFQDKEAYSVAISQPEHVNLRLDGDIPSYVQSNQLENSDQDVKHFSQQEIHNNKYKAELEKARAESDISHLEYMIKSKIRMGEPHSALDSSLHDAKGRLQHAKNDLNKWRNEKPDDR